MFRKMSLALLATASCLAWSLGFADRAFAFDRSPLVEPSVIYAQQAAVRTAYAQRSQMGGGRPGFGWSGVKTISAKKEWPAWTPPPEMLARRPDLPRHMEGGPQNPLGARAMYLGSSLYRIHGSNEPWTIGTNVSSGCIRMRNEDVMDLYGRVNVGARVVVI